MRKAIQVITILFAIGVLGWLFHGIGFYNGLVIGLKNGIKDEYAETTMQIIWLRGLADRDALTDTKRKISEHVANKIRDLRLKKETMQQLSAIRYLQDRVTGHNYYMDLADMSSPDLEKLEKRYRSAIDMMILKQEN